MSFVVKLRSIYDKNKLILQNFSYITILQVFLMAIPLITYPYLIRVLGVELYGYVITAQVVASYCSVVIDFGFKGVSARHISIHRDDTDKLSEIMSTILVVRIVLWMICFFVYVLVVLLIDSYRVHLLLFLFSFGITFNELLFPQFFYQGIEKMKMITILNILIRGIFVILIFVFISSKEDYFYVPLFYSIGYFIGGIASLYILVKKYQLYFVKPTIKNILFYTKDALPIFYTDIVCTVKDKFSYIIVGQYVGMSEVPIYDLGSKFVRLTAKPTSIISTVLFPRIAKDKDLKLFNNGLFICFGITFLIVIFMNIFLSPIVGFFMDRTIDLLPLRLFLLAPIFLSVGGYIASNLMISLGYNKYILHSIIITTITYCLGLVIFYSIDYMNLNAMIIVAVIAYFTEFLYRIIMSKKIIENEKSRK